MVSFTYRASAYPVTHIYDLPGDITNGAGFVDPVMLVLSDNSIYLLNGNPFSPSYNTITDTIVSDQPLSGPIYTNPHNGLSYILRYGYNTISIIARHTFSSDGNIVLGDTDCAPDCSGGPYGLMINPLNGEMYVVVAENNEVFIKVINDITNTVDNTRTIHLGPLGAVFGMVFSPDFGGRFYFINNNAISVIDTKGNPVAGPINVGDPTQQYVGMAYNPYDHNIYVLKLGAYQVIPRPGFNDCAGVGEDHCGDLLCTQGSIHVINGLTNTEIPSLVNADLHCPTGIAFTPSGDIFVSQHELQLGGNFHCENPGRVVALDKSLAIKEGIPVGPCPGAIVYNSMNGNIYVTSTNDGKWICLPGDGCSPTVPTPISVISTVHPFISSLTTSIIDNSNGWDVSGRDGPSEFETPFGWLLHDSATMTIDWSPHVPYYIPPRPTGNVEYQIFDNPDCSGSSRESVPVVSLTNTGTIPDSEPFNSNLPPVLSTRAWYLGDFNYNYPGMSGTCVQVNVQYPRISTMIKNESDLDITKQTVTVGTVIHDTAKLMTDVTPTPSTSIIPPDTKVTYQRYLSDPKKLDIIGCNITEHHTDETVLVNSHEGAIPNSSPFRLNNPDIVTYRIVYDGLHYSICEQLNAIPKPGTIMTAIRNNNGDDLIESPIPLGTEVHDSAVLNTGTAIVPTDTTTYQHFSTTDCTGDHTDETVRINSDGTVPDSKPLTLTSSELVSYKAIYNSPSGTLTSTCQPLQTIISIEIRDDVNNIISDTTIDQGTMVHASATITGPVDLSTGTISYEIFRGTNCIGDPINVESMRLNGDGTIHDSSPSHGDGTMTTDVGDFSYQAAYRVDSGSITVSSCKSLNIQPTE